MIYIIEYLIITIASAIIYCKLDILNSPYEDYIGYACLGFIWWITLPIVIISLIVKFIDKVILK